MRNGIIIYCMITQYSTSYECIVGGTLISICTLSILELDERRVFRFCNLIIINFVL